MGVTQARAVQAESGRKRCLPTLSTQAHRNPWALWLRHNARLFRELTVLADATATRSARACVQREGCPRRITSIVLTSRPSTPKAPSSSASMKPAVAQILSPSAVAAK